MMKIYDRGTAPTGTGDVGKSQETARTGRSDTQRSGSSGSSGSGDTVELSSAAGTLRQALETSSASRSRHVQSLQAAYQSGSYRPDSQETSRGMVREALAGGVA